jgi:hypothetical protein
VAATGRHLKAALALAARGMRIFPCTARGKTPATAHGVKDATSDPVRIESWWLRDPSYNLAIATGAVSGIFVVDVDGLDAEAALRALEAEHGALPVTVEVVTGAGRHIWLKHPADTTIANSASKIAPGIDVRGDGGYALAPPSVHPSGRRYCWSVDCAKAVAEAPAWLLAKIAVPNGGDGTATPPSEWLRLAESGVSEGTRNDAIARLTGHLLRRRVDPRVALELVRTWNSARCRPPLADTEVEQVVNSIAGKELKRRQEAGRGRR